jgi:hypothetical protein
VGNLGGTAGRVWRFAGRFATRVLRRFLFETADFFDDFVETATFLPDVAGGLDAAGLPVLAMGLRDTSACRNGDALTDTARRIAIIADRGSRIRLYPAFLKIHLLPSKQALLHFAKRRCPGPEKTLRQ